MGRHFFLVMIAVTLCGIGLAVAFIGGFATVNQGSDWMRELLTGKPREASSTEETVTHADDESDEWEVEYFDGSGNRLGAKGAQVETISTGEQVDIRKHLANSGLTIVEFTAEW